MKKISVNIIIWVIAPIIGIVFSAAYYYLAIPITKSDLFLCIILGAFSGLLNYAVVVGLFKKFDILKKSNLILQNDLCIDKLTGIFNRRAYDHDLEKLRDENSYSMIFIDIDNFKKFNDQYGHKVGDQVLIEVAKAIQANLRNSDRVYRYGGEEFVAVLKDCDKKNALDISEKIRKGVESMEYEPYALISVSLGVSSYPEDGPDAASIAENSDRALLHAKKHGKNRIHVHQNNSL